MLKGKIHTLGALAPGELPRKRALWRRTLKIVDRILAVLVIFIAIVCLFLQTTWFRELLISQIESIVEKETNGVIAIESIGGNFLSGFTLNNVHLKLRSSGDTSDIVSIKQIYARYNIVDLLAGNGITIKELKLREPIINLQREVGDSLWNLDKLFLKKQETKDEPSSPFTTVIDLWTVRIEDAKISRIDKNDTLTIKEIKKGVYPVRWDNIIIEDLDLDITARIEGENKQHVRINHLGFGDKHSGFTLHRLGLVADRNNDIVELDSMVLVTNESTLSLKASIDPLTILKGSPYDSMGKAITSLDLNAKAISTSELRQLLPVLDFLGGTPGIVLSAKGEYGKLAIKKGTLDLHKQGKLTFSGSVNNLHKPENISFDIKLQGKNLSDASVKTYIPGIPTGDLKPYGDITIKNVHYTGTPLHFSSELDIETSSGIVKGKSSLDMRGKTPLFDVDIASTKINLGRILGDTSLVSDLNVDLKMKGSSFDPKYMDAEFSINTSAPTKLGKYGVTDLSTSGSLRAGILTTRNTNINVSGGGSIKSDYVIVDVNGDKPKFEVEMTARDIPVSQYIPTFNKNITLTLSTNLKGEGFSPDAMEGSLQSKISGMRYKNEVLPPVKLDAVFKRNEDGTRMDNINSDIADVSLEGRYSVESLPIRLAEHINALTHEARKGDSVAGATGRTTQVPSDMKYEIDVKDLRALYQFIPDQILLGEAEISGRLVETADGLLNVTAEGNIYKFLLKNRPSPESAKTGGAGPNIRIYDTTTFRLKLNDLTRTQEHVIDSLVASFVLQSDSSIRVNGAMLSEPELSLDASNKQAIYTLSTGVNNLLDVYLKGGARYSRSSIQLPIDTIALDFGNNYVWRTEKKPTIVLDTSGHIIIDTLAFIRPDPGYDPENLLTQRFRLGVDIMGDSIRHAFIDAPHLKLKELPLFFGRGRRDEQFSSLTGRVTKLYGNVSGSLSNPKANLDILVRNFAFNNVTFDSSLFTLALSNHTLRGLSTFHVDTGKFQIESRRNGLERLNLPGNNMFTVVLDSFPVDFTLSDKDSSKDVERLSKDRRFGMHATANGFPLDFFGPFLPLVSNAHGIVNAELRMFGTLDSIQLEGDAALEKSTVVISNTNVPYRIDGSLSFNEDEIRFDSLLVKNLPTDDQSGSALVYGWLEMKGFTPGAFDFTMKTNRFTVMTDATKDVLPNIYGPLAIKSGLRPIRFFGTLDMPHLEGDLTIAQGFLTLPQNTTSSSANTGDIIYRTLEYEYEEGKITEAKEETIIPELTIYDIEDGDNDTVITSLQKIQTQGVAHNDQQVSFSDKMLYDLDIAIPGDFWINIFFARGMGLLGEQLSAELMTERNLSLKRAKTLTPLRFTGDLTVTEKSSYKLIRDFNPVYGTISFINDITNPNLNIKAEYGAYNSINTSEYYKILLKITGTANEPKLGMEIYKRNESTRQFIIDDKHKGDQVVTDGLYFLTTNAFQTDLSQTESANVASQLANSIPSGVANSFINGLIGSSDLKNYIRNVSLDYGGSLETTKLKVTAGYQDITFQYGAQSLKDPSAADYTVEVPASTFIKFKNSKNLILQFVAHTYSLTSSTTTVINKPNFESTVMYRFPIPGHNLSIW